MYEVAIIGAGPAGISATLTLKSLGVGFIWFGSGALSAKIRNAEKINNYPGLCSASGKEMQTAFLRQIKDAGIEITEKTVTGVYPVSGRFTLLCNDEAFEAKSVILATGVESVKPMKGEAEFLGRGVSYCATCDGALYRGKEIAVICTDKEYEREIALLASFAVKVYLVPLYKDVAVDLKNVEILRGMPTEIAGTTRVGKLVFRNGEKAVDGVFLLKSASPPDVLVNGLNMQDGHVVANRACETNIPGIFAAGDCTGRPYQYAKAAGEGNVAAHSAYTYLTKLR